MTILLQIQKSPDIRNLQLKQFKHYLFQPNNSTLRTLLQFISRHLSDPKMLIQQRRHVNEHVLGQIYFVPLTQVELFYNQNLPLHRIFDESGKKTETLLATNPRANTLLIDIHFDILEIIKSEEMIDNLVEFYKEFPVVVAYILLLFREENRTTSSHLSSNAYSID
jgi:hypothetical protein